jgi:hypothetical protein
VRHRASGRVESTVAVEVPVLAHDRPLEFRRGYERHLRSHLRGRRAAAEVDHYRPSRRDADKRQHPHQRDHCTEPCAQAERGNQTFPAASSHLGHLHPSYRTGLPWPFVLVIPFRTACPTRSSVTIPPARPCSDPALPSPYGTPLGTACPTWALPGPGLLVPCPSATTLHTDIGWSMTQVLFACGSPHAHLRTPWTQAQPAAESRAATSSGATPPGTSSIPSR